MSDESLHKHRELLETYVGLAQILRESTMSRDFNHFENAKDELIAVRLARIDERLANLRLLVGALAGALSVMAGAIAILAD